MRKLAVALLLTLIATISLTPRLLAQEQVKAMAELTDVNGTSVGTLTLDQAGSEVHISGQLSNLPPGPHGFHIHAVGACTPDFTAAGGHYNPDGKQHGLSNPQGPHAGDLPNLEASTDGTVTVDYRTSTVTLRDGANTLFDSDGSAIVVHAAADDNMTDPSGNSGDRIACGVIQLVQSPSAGETMQPQPPAGGTDSPASLPSTGSSGGVGLLALLVVAGLVALSGLLIRRRSASR